MKTRRARPADAAAIHALIAHYAAQGLLLPRTAADVRAHVDRFLVLEDGGGIVACVALEPYGAELAEIRSLAVDPRVCGKGLGPRLVRYALGVAKRRRIARVFAVTHAPDFFGRQGFVVSKSAMAEALPEKVARDCCGCPKAAGCNLVAVVATLIPERIALPVLAANAKPLPAV